jgi:hypothetical protein
MIQRTTAGFLIYHLLMCDELGGAIFFKKLHSLINSPEFMEPECPLPWPATGPYPESYESRLHHTTLSLQSILISYNFDVRLGPCVSNGLFANLKKYFTRRYTTLWRDSN